MDQAIAGGSSPTDTASDGWFICIDGHEQGPLAVDDIRTLWRAGGIAVGTLCWRHGFAGWQPMSRVPEFLALLEGDWPQPIAPPPAPPESLSAPALSALVQEELTALSAPKLSPPIDGISTYRPPVPSRPKLLGLWLAVIGLGALAAVLGLLLLRPLILAEPPDPVPPKPVPAPAVTPVAVETRPPPEPVEKLPPLKRLNTAPAVPTVEALEPEDVLEVVKARRPGITTCVKAHGKGEGTLVMRWNISKQGRTSGIRAEDEEQRGSALERCVVKEISRWAFPAHRTPTAPILFPFKY